MYVSCCLNLWWVEVCLFFFDINGRLILRLNCSFLCKHYDVGIRITIHSIIHKERCLRTENSGSIKILKEYIQKHIIYVVYLLTIIQIGQGRSTHFPSIRSEPSLHSHHFSVAPSRRSTHSKFVSEFWHSDDCVQGCQYLPMAYCYSNQWKLNIQYDLIMNE